MVDMFARGLGAAAQFGGLLGKEGYHSVQHRRHYSVRALIRDGIPAVAFGNRPTLNGVAGVLTPSHYRIIRESLLKGARINPNTVFGPGTRAAIAHAGNAANALQAMTAAHNAYHGLAEEDRYKVASHLVADDLDVSDIPRAALVPGSPAYDALPTIQKDRVRRRFPGSQGFLEMSPEAQSALLKELLREDAFHEGVQPLTQNPYYRMAELAVCGIKKTHYYMEDHRYNSRAALLAKGIPPAVLVLENANFNALAPNEQAEIVGILLSDEVNRPLPAAGIVGPATAARPVLVAAVNAYNLLPPRSTGLVDAYLLSRRGIPGDAFGQARVEDSPRYHQLSGREQCTVRQYCPETNEYQRLNLFAREIVDKRNYTEGVIKTSYSSYYKKIFPSLRYQDIPQLSATETVRYALLSTRSVVDAANRQLRLIERTPPAGVQDLYPSLRKWNIGLPSKDNLFPDEDNPNNPEGLRQVLFSQHRAMWDWVMETERTVQKKWRFYMQCIKALRRYRWYVYTRHLGDKSTVAKDSISTFFSKLLGGNGYATEPMIGRVPLPLTFFEGRGRAT